MKNKISSNKNTKPLKVFRCIDETKDIKTLLEPEITPVFQCDPYPTPKWFNSSKADISVIVPVFKSDIATLINSWDDCGLNVEIIFIDDACPNDSKNNILRLWKESKPVGKIFCNSSTQGFKTCCNLGAYHASGDILIFLDPNSSVTPNWIKPMTRLLKPNIGIVGNLHIANGKVESAGLEWNWQDKKFLSVGKNTYQNKKISNQFHLNNCPQDILTEVQDRDAVSTTCFAIKKQLFQEIGGFCTKNDVHNLCLTIKEQGYKIIYTPNSKIHVNPKEEKVHPKSRIQFINKWVTTGRIDPLIKEKRKEFQKPKNVLIKRTAASGDVLVATNIAGAIKKKYGWNVYFTSQHGDFVSNHPFIDGFIQKEQTSARRFQIYYNLDLTYETRPFTNILDAYCQAAGVERSLCEFFLKTQPVDNLPDDYIVFHAGKTNWVGRDWVLSKFEIVANRLLQKGKNIISIGHGKDEKVPCTLDLRHKTNVHELAHVIKNAKLFVGIDSFPMHVAQTFNVPGVCFFGSIDPKTRIYRDNMKAVTANINCLGCHHRKLPPSTVTDVCETYNNDCVNQVTVDQMMKEIDKHI